MCSVIELEVSYTVAWDKPQILDSQENKGSKALLFGGFSEPYGSCRGISAPYSDEGLLLYLNEFALKNI